MGVSIAPAAPRFSSAQRRLVGLLPLLFLFWLSCHDGRVPAFLSPTVKRTLYFKLPIDGTRFHWRFRDGRAFLSGELTLRIINADRDRDQTLVIFRDGKVTEGWGMIDDVRADSSFYFGFSTEQRFATSAGDSVIITLRADEDLQGRGPYSQGTLTKGTWVATGTYSALYGGTLSPIRDLAWVGQSPIAFLECWDTTWKLKDAKKEGWMGPKPTGEDDVSWFERLKPARGVDGRRCVSTL